MSNLNVPNLAIIGGGQLGMLLCEAAREIGVQTLIITPDGEGPAVSRADNTIIAEMDAEGLAADIAAQVNTVTYELEDVPLSLLEALEKEEADGNIRVRPAIGLLRLLKNKATQKQWLDENDFPTLPFIILENPGASRQQLLEFGFPFVQKAQTGGYDGYGVQVIEDEAGLKNLWDVPSIIEQYISKPVEIGVVIARSESGDSFAYDPVRMDFKSGQNILDAVIYPTGFDESKDFEAVELAIHVINQLNGVGVFAVEMFSLADNKIIINEISPRVHNSGHHTLETNGVSQFEQHVRAVCDLPLLEPGKTTGTAVMRNLLYSDELEFLLKYPPGVLSSDAGDVHLCWYGKKEGREGRKMGHVTCLDSNPQESRQLTTGFIQQLQQRDEGAAA